MIVTGGTTGDVGLHDFRYIATGKMRKQDQYKNGMLWYIPKAHLGANPCNPNSTFHVLSKSGKYFSNYDFTTGANFQGV